jgi:hypothetical protein
VLAAVFAPVNRRILRTVLRAVLGSWPAPVHLRRGFRTGLIQQASGRWLLYSGTELAGESARRLPPRAARSWAEGTLGRAVTWRRWPAWTTTASAVCWVADREGGRHARA